MANYTKEKRLLRHYLRIAKATTISTPERQKYIGEHEKDYDKWFEYYFPNYAKVKCASFEYIRILTHDN